jgi:NADH-quinone oxidoreductase subunit D
MVFLDFLKKFRVELKGWVKLLAKNAIWLNRNIGVGVVTKEDAIAQGFTGPSLRGSGVPLDIRTFEPYLVYDQVQFDIPVREEGDCFSRYYVRMDEMEQSIRIIEQCLAKMPQGIIRVDNAKKTYPSKDEVYYSMEGLIHDFMMTHEGLQLPKGEIYHAIEAPKGELGFYFVSNCEGHPWKCKIRSPSFNNLQSISHLVKGYMVSDVVAIIGSIDPVMGEADK